MIEFFARRTLMRATHALLILVITTAAAHAKCTGINILPKLVKSHPEIMKQARADADKILNTKAIFWRISKSGIAPSHLFGTMHVSDPRIATLTKQAKDILQASKVLALEIADLSPGAAMMAVAKSPQLMVYTDGSRLDQKLTGAEFKLVSGLLAKSGMPAQMAPMTRPWLVSIMLSVPECEQRRVARGWKSLDAFIAIVAKGKNVRVIGLETIESQMKSMANIPDTDQITMLQASLAFLKERDNLFETLIQSYLKRDLGIVLTLTKALAKIAKLKSPGFESFSRELIIKRNHGMFDTSRPLINKGNAFVAVGAAHLIGETGLVALYRKAGFTVTAIN